MGYPGQFEHEYQDARTFAEWGVDFFKVARLYCRRRRTWLRQLPSVPIRIPPVPVPDPSPHPSDLCTLAYPF